MREINVCEVSDAVAQMCIDANYYISDDINQALISAEKNEESERARYILRCLTENAEIARKEKMPICQDTGMAVVFLNIGQEIHFVGGDLYNAVNEGVRRGYRDGYLRCSVVSDPLERKNTGDNTPAIIHVSIIPGDRLEIIVAPKGFGSENMSRIKMLKPSDGKDGVVDFVLETVKIAGANPCPPVVVGVGIGGDMELSAVMAKRALTRDIREANTNPYYGELEEELLEKINYLGVGPQGMGGATTALGVNIETFPTHIAGLPVAVNISCHVTRHLKKII